MQFIKTVFELSSILLLTFIMGLPFTKLLLPRDIEQDYGFYIAPTVGYLVFCLAAFTLSSTFGTAVDSTCWGIMFSLLILGVATQLRRAWRVAPSLLGGQLKHSLLLMLPMVLVILFPLFYFGAKYYLGAVNPDFFAGVVDNYYLAQGHSVNEFKSGADSYYPIDYLAGTLTASARFGAGVFGILTELLLGVSTRTSLSLIIGFFLLNLPLVIYFFSSVVLGFTRRQATFSGLLMGISGPVCMSYLYYYLGQNSGLPALPLVLTATYLMLTRPSVKTLMFCAILSNALFVNYFAMLPYALAPAVFLGLYLLFSRRMSFWSALGLIFGFIAVFVLIHVGNINNIIKSMQAWGNVIGQTVQGQYFIDFLTELFMPLYFGVTEYPVGNSWFSILIGGLRGTCIALIASGAILIFWIWSIVNWVKNTKEIERKVFILSAFVIYLAVWWVYSFPRQYAYAIFKMSSWLQFILVPFMAHGVLTLHGRLKKNLFKKSFFKNLLTKIGYAVGVCYIVLNFTTSVQYIYNGFGRNTNTGYIVNNFEMSGNHDYFELSSALEKFVKPKESITILFVDSIQNFWVSYYLHSFRQSIPFHEDMPGDDENLPDIVTSTIMDYYGYIFKVENPFEHNFQDNYLLTWNNHHLNQDIIVSNYSATPLWENHTFRLFNARDVYDLLATGRGFYRLEYLMPHKNYWLPPVIRWSANGGEFYLLRVKSPGKPYRIGFDAVIGYGVPSDSRTVELWLNGKLFQTITLTNAARVVSDPFYPQGGTNRIVVYIKEKSRAIKRRLALWNNDIPSDYRLNNIAFANARIFPPDLAMKYKVVPQGTPVNFMHIFELAKQFNGLQLDGWIGDEASLKFNVPVSVKRIVLNGFIAGEFIFPYQFQVKINSVISDLTIETPGDFTFKLAVPKHEEDIDIFISPSHSIDAGHVDIRHKLIRHSIRIKSINFV